MPFWKRAGRSQREASTPPARMESGLNGAQRRTVSVTLAHALETLDRIERLARLTEGASPLWSGALDDERRHGVLAAGDAMRRDIFAALAALRLDLPGHDIASAIRGEAGLLWSDLEEIMPRRLTGYGSLAPDAAETLARHVPGLAHAARALSELRNLDREQ